jgi:peroxiredoxin
MSQTAAKPQAPSYVQLLPGDPAPWFRQRSTSSGDYAFDTAAGRYLVLCFFGSAGHEHGRAALRAVAANRQLFDDQRFAFFGVSLDPQDEAENRVQQSMPGIRFLLGL